MRLQNFSREIGRLTLVSTYDIVIFACKRHAFTNADFAPVFV